MRVLHVDSGREWRGGQTQLLYLIRSGPRPAHVALPPGAPVSRALTEAGASLHPVDFRGPMRGTRALRQLVRRLRPELLAAHTSHAHAHAARLSELVPVVVHRRVDFALKQDRLARRKYARPAGYVAVSAAVRRVLKEGGVPAARVRVVHDGVDAAALQPLPERRRARAELGLADDRPLVLAVGALVTHKDHATLLRALPALRDQLPRVLLWIAGEGELRAELQHLAAELELGSSLRLLGQREDVPRLLAAADVFCHPSREEGMGQAVVEAMLAACPVVATRAGGVPEVVHAPHTGLLVPARRPVVLAEALVDALQAPKERRLAWGRAGRARAEAHFSVEAMVRGTLRAYAELRAGVAGRPADIGAGEAR